MVETRRQQIEDAASQLFRERGYSATSVRDIARAIDIQGGSLYAHVASKEDVLWSIVERAAGHFVTRVAPIAERHGFASERLAEMIRVHVDVITADLGHAAVFLDEWRFLSPGRRELVREQRRLYQELFRRVIDDGVATGEFASDDPSLTAMAILSTLNGIATWYRPDGRLAPARIAERYGELFLRALQPPPGTPRPGAHDRDRPVRA